MTEEHMLSCVSFLLGKTHGGIMNIIHTAIDEDDFRDLLIKFEAELRKDIERLYYPDIIRDPALN